MRVKLGGKGLLSKRQTFAGCRILIKSLILAHLIFVIDFIISRFVIEILYFIIYREKVYDRFYYISAHSDVFVF